MSLNPRRILAIQVSRIGDTILTTPALRAIAAAWPHAQLDVLAHPKRGEVLQNLPFLRRVGGITKKSAPWRGWEVLVTGKRYDLAFVWGFDEALVHYALRVASNVVAYVQRDTALNARLYKAVTPPPAQGMHAVPFTRTLTDALSIVPTGDRLSYVVTEAEHASAVQRLAKDLPVHAAPKIGLQVASFPTRSYRDWPIEHFRELCERIRNEWPRAQFLIFGGPQERDRTSALQRALGKCATDYAGLPLRPTGALMSLLDLYIGVDTGPTHLMSCFDVPLVSLHHGYLRSELIAARDHPCAFPVDHPLAGPNCSTDVSMADITVDAVMVRVREALKSPCAHGVSATSAR